MRASTLEHLILNLTTPSRFMIFTDEASFLRNQSIAIKCQNKYIPARLLQKIANITDGLWLQSNKNHINNVREEITILM